MWQVDEEEMTGRDGPTRRAKICKYKFIPIAENQTIEKKNGMEIIICINE